MKSPLHCRLRAKAPWKALKSTRTRPKKKATLPATSTQSSQRQPKLEKRPKRYNFGRSPVARIVLEAGTKGKEITGVICARKLSLCDTS